MGPAAPKSEKPQPKQMDNSGLGGSRLSCDCPSTRSCANPCALLASAKGLYAKKGKRTVHVRTGLRVLGFPNERTMVWAEILYCGTRPVETKEPFNLNNKENIHESNHNR